MLYIYTSLFLWFICFFVHVHLVGLWVLEIYIQWKKCTSLLFFFNFFSSFAFFFSWTTLHFLKCLLSFVGLFRTDVVSLHRGQRILKLFFGFFSLFSCFCFFLVILLFLYVFVLTLLVVFFFSIVSLCLQIMFCWSINICIVQFWNILCSLSYFWRLKIFLDPPQILLEVMEYCSKTLQIIILILGVGSKNIL